MILNIKTCNISRQNGQFFVVYISNGFLIWAAFLVMITWRLFSLTFTYVYLKVGRSVLRTFF